MKCKKPVELLQSTLDLFCVEFLHAYVSVYTVYIV